MIERFGLYLVMTNPVAGYERCAEAAVQARLRYLQLRMKRVPREHVEATARAVRAITAGSTTRFILNDDADLAARIGADGVHLGQTDEPIHAARARHPNLLFGLSTHDAIQAGAACANQPDYIGVGPVFATPTKEIPDPTLGLDTLGAIIRQSPVTTVAIGGIHAGNLPDVLRAGAINFAVVRDVCASANPYDVIRRLQDIWERFTDPTRCESPRPSH
ncbi:MAG: thiamine phosphate synthase [Lentisphaerae bacterium]|nr:thiamine phosphate synthase [Lentisphaerota bacterium]